MKAFTKTLLYLAGAFFFLASSVLGFVPVHYHGPSSPLSTKKCETSLLMALNSNQRDNTYLTQVQASTSATTPTAAVISPLLNPIEAWCVTNMDHYYSATLSIKCPFMRRRMADLLDGLDMIMRFVLIRHKSLDLIGPPPGCRTTTKSRVEKNKNLALSQVCSILERDWRRDTNKGYYITGRLNTTIYRDDCLFDGPDPDMPVRGLRKYLNAASHLFDHSTSTAQLLSIQVVDEDRRIIGVTWKLQGVLHLPWHPQLPTWTGQTEYHLDKDGLIHLHKESWDISVLEAFTRTLLPETAKLIWR